MRAATGGNPLFVRMAVERGLSAAGEGLTGLPELRHLVLAHLDGLGEPARELLDAASVLGERIDLQVLADVSGRSPAEVGTVLDQAVARGVLASAPDVAGLSFAHALVRDAVYNELAPSRRMALHERAACALERSEHATARAGQIAGHWQRSGGPDSAAHCVQWAREAARSAAALLAYDEAARFTVLALHAAEADGTQPGGLRAELALDAVFQDGDLAVVDRELARVEQFAAYGRHSLASWHLHRLRATRAALVGELDAAVAHNEAARAVAAQIGAFSTSGMYYAFLGQLALLRGAIDRELAETTLRMLRQLPGIPLVRIFVPLTYALLGEQDLARATFEEFRHMPGAIEVGPRWAALVTLIGIVALLLDDTDTADRVYRELSGLATTCMADGSGAVFSGGSAQRVAGDLALATGRVGDPPVHRGHRRERADRRPAVSRAEQARTGEGDGGPGQPR